MQGTVIGKNEEAERRNIFICNVCVKIFRSLMRGIKLNLWKYTGLRIGKLSFQVTLVYYIDCFILKWYVGLILSYKNSLRVW